MKQLNTLPFGDLIQAKPAVPVNVTQAQTIGYFRGILGAQACVSGTERVNKTVIQ